MVYIIPKRFDNLREWFTPYEPDNNLPWNSIVKSPLYSYNNNIITRENVIMFNVPGFTKNEIKVEKRVDKIVVECISERNDAWINSLILEHTYIGNINTPCKLENGILYVYIDNSDKSSKNIPIEGD